MQPILRQLATQINQIYKKEKERNKKRKENTKKTILRDNQLYNFLLFFYNKKRTKHKY